MNVHRSALAAGLLAGALATAVGCGGKSAAPQVTQSVTVTSSPSPTPSPSPTVTVTNTPPPTVTVTPTPTPTVTVTRSAPTSAPAASVPHLTNASAVVEQYYQDITNHDYAAAWALGGANIAGPSYASYVAGFATTASISLGTVSEFNSSTVQAVLYATQTDGTVKVYQGTYTVNNGVLVAANIHQVS
ncbi:hypothetical protein [Kitasatospora azatica]|uniref:hypothetical protein n=1 Tax=Kitasatospora azatica TaxID=58347 RepID=UPI0012FBE30C|nr:hypothetical protein [Kitasatospora azatica]